MQAWTTKYRSNHGKCTHLFFSHGHLSGIKNWSCEKFTKENSKFEAFFIFQHLTSLKYAGIMSPSFQGGAHHDAVHVKAEYRLFRCVQLRTGYLLCSIRLHGWFYRSLQGHCHSGSVLFYFHSGACIHLHSRFPHYRPVGTSGTGMGPCKRNASYYDVQA